MVKISGTTITMTRGDTLLTTVAMRKRDGTYYTPQEGDVVRFAMKRNYGDTNPTILKTLDNDTLKLLILPNETKQLAYGDYVYDIELTTADGNVDTFIHEAKLTLAKEVH